MSDRSPVTPILRVDGLKVYFQTRERLVRAVDGATFEVLPQKGLAVIGESGSGKTLSMLATLGLVSGVPGVVAGSICYGDESSGRVEVCEGVEEAFAFNEEGVPRTLSGAWKWRRRMAARARLLAGRRIGMIFQNPIASLDPLWSVGRTLAESIGCRARWQGEKPNRDKVKEEAQEWLERVHIKNPAEVLRSYPHQLSGGMCQRVAIAATLALRPRVIVADEPTTGLDMTTKAQVLTLLREARESFGATLVFITHEIGLVQGLVERTVVMRAGRVVDRLTTKRLCSLVPSTGAIDGGELGADEDEEAPVHRHTLELVKATLELEDKVMGTADGRDRTSDGAAT